jgi:hypothetical protein
MRRVEIAWIDAQDHGDAWVPVEEVEQFGLRDCTIMSMGYLVKHTDKYYTLAGDFDKEDGNFGRVTKIPSKWVVSVEYLDVAPKNDD